MVRVNGKEVRWRDGMTIVDLLRDLGDSYPYPVVRVGDKVISPPEFKKTVVPNDSEVFLIPLIAGG